MTPREQAAFNAGVEAMRQMAMTTAVTIEVRDDARDLRQRAAAAALHGLAEGGRALKVADEPDLVHCAFALIAEEKGPEGVVPCPVCAGSLQWTRAESNGHIWGKCETDGCLSWMQ